MNYLYCYDSRAVMIQSLHDMIHIVILASRYDMYRDTIFMHMSQLESFNTLGKQVQNHLIVHSCVTMPV